jgi:hypothetical protein
MLLFSHFLSLIVKNMENLKDVERKVVYPTKGPLKMDTCGFAIIYCATISTKLKCVVYYLSLPIT